MNKLEKRDDLRIQAEEALKRGISGLESKNELDTYIAAVNMSGLQLGLLLENETLRLKRDQLQEELEAHKNLINESPVVYITLNNKGRIIQLNKAAHQFFSDLNIDPVSTSLEGFMGEKTLAKLRMAIRKAWKTGNEQTFIIPVKNSTQPSLQYRLVVSAYTDGTPDDKLNKMLITAFPEKEIAELKENEKALNELMSNISEGIFCTENGILNSVNPSLARLLGYTENQLEGKPLWEFVTDCYRQKVKNIFKKENDNDPSLIDVKCIRNDGTVFWAELKVNQLRYGSKSFGTLTDVSERKISENRLKNSERSLKRSNAAKDKLFSIISHDLRTPFNTLMGYTYLLSKEYKNYDEKKREGMIQSLYDVTRQAFTMLENVLTWSRTQTGSIPFAPRAINLSSLLLESTRLYIPTARAKSINLMLDPEIRETIAFADPEMIQMVIRNLVQNAIKFTPEKGKISLGVIDDNDDMITIYVKDNGLGISPDKIGHLFRVDTNYSTRGTNDEKGTGLGLAICKEFTEKNGGDIWVESTPGQGSCFYFTLYKKIQTEV